VAATATIDPPPPASGQAAIPTGTPVPSVTVTARATAETSTPSPVPTDLPTPEPERVRVTGSGNQFVNMRREPGTDSAVVKALRDGTEVIIVGIDRESDGRLWRNVQDGDAIGWIVSTALRPLPTPPPTPSNTATSATTPTVTVVASTTPQPAASPTPSEPTATLPSLPSLPSSGQAGQAEPERVEVFDTGSGGANLRAEPGIGGRIVQSLPDGTRLTVVGQDREVDGRAWRNVRGEAGTIGWVADEVVRSLATSTPAVTATPSSAPTAPATTPTPTPDPSMLEPVEPTPEPERVEVFGTGTQGANLRAQPGRRSSVLQSVPDGSHLTIIGEDQDADGSTWRNVQTDDGTTGWLAVEVIRTLVTPTPTPRPGAPGIGAPIGEEPEPEEEQTEEERAATPCRPGQLKGDAATGIYYPVDHPEYAGLRERVRCFDDASRARASGFRSPEVLEPLPSPEASPATRY
jgi:uncharacterized protein YgiM (DUF1202 family)